MSDIPEISFCDNVRVRTTPETAAAGLAGLNGQVYGETTPSVTGVEVIGEVDRDYAVNVFFTARNEGFWFAPQLLEFVDHGPGTVIEIAGKKAVRSATGEWKTVTDPTHE